MPYNTYTALVSAIQVVQEDSGQEYVDYINTALQLGQDRMRKELDANIFKTNVEVTCSAGDRFIFKPAGYRFSYNAFIVDTSSGRETQLYHQPDDFLRNYWDVPTSTGVPKYYGTDYNQTQFMLAPTPNLPYVIRLNVQADLDYLSAGNNSNFVSQYYGQELYFASMVEMMAFSKDPDKKQMWEAAYINAIQGANNEAAREDQPDGETKVGNDEQNILKVGQTDRT